MKKCFYFPTWEAEDASNISISLDEKVIEKIPQIKCLQSIPSDPTLTQLCKLTGAKIYLNQLAKMHIDINRKWFGIDFYILLDTKDNATSGDIIIKMKNSGLFSNYFECMCLLNINTHDKHELQEINYVNIKEEIQKMRTNLQYARRSLDPRKDIGLTKKEEKEFAEKIKNATDNNLIKSYFTKIAPPGLHCYTNVFEQYSRFLQNKENEWEEIKELLRI